MLGPSSFEARKSAHLRDDGSRGSAPVNFSHRRGAVGVEGLDGLQPPGLAFLAFLFGPHDRLPVRRQDQPRAGIGDFDAIAAGFIDIKKECLLDRVLVRSGFDMDAVLQEDVGGAQDLLAAVEGVGDVVEAPRRGRR